MLLRLERIIKGLQQPLIEKTSSQNAEQIKKHSGRRSVVLVLFH